MSLQVYDPAQYPRDAMAVVALSTHDGDPPPALALIPWLAVCRKPVSAALRSLSTTPVMVEGCVRVAVSRPHPAPVHRNDGGGRPEHAWPTGRPEAGIGRLALLEHVYAGP